MVIELRARGSLEDEPIDPLENSSYHRVRVLSEASTSSQKREPALSSNGRSADFRAAPLDQPGLNTTRHPGKDLDEGTRRMVSS